MSSIYIAVDLVVSISLLNLSIHGAGDLIVIIRLVASLPKKLGDDGKAKVYD